jgi:hypothetical protein
MPALLFLDAKHTRIWHMLCSKLMVRRAPLCKDRYASQVSQSGKTFGTSQTESNVESQTHHQNAASRQHCRALLLLLLLLLLQPPLRPLLMLRAPLPQLQPQSHASRPFTLSSAMLTHLL